MNAKNFAFRLVIILALLFIGSSLSSSLPAKTVTVYKIPINGTIDLGLTAFIRRSAAEIRAAKPAAVVFEIDTFGGRVDAAKEIVTSMHSLKDIPTFAFITDAAWSAGALLSLAAQNIIMQEGSSIGSAEPRQMGLNAQQELTDEKIISALRAQFKATAEVHGHSANLAQAMVDKDIELVQVEHKNETVLLTREELEERKQELGKRSFRNEKVISAKGKLVNLTAEEARNLNLAQAVVENESAFMDLLKQKLGLQPEDQIEVITTQPHWAENLVRCLTHPIVSSLLLSLGFLGILFELRMPGWGISGTLGALFLLLFFWGHFLVGLADWMDIAVFVIGLILLFIEVFITPGFGVMGATGMVLVVAGLFLTMLRHPFTMPSLELDRAIRIITYTVLFLSTGIILLFKYLPRTNAWKRVTLQAQEDKSQGYHSGAAAANLAAGKAGKAKTYLRPSGRAVFDGKAVDVVTAGEFIGKNRPVKIVRIEGTKIVVEEIRQTKEA